MAINGLTTAKITEKNGSLNNNNFFSPNNKQYDLGILSFRFLQINILNNFNVNN